MKVILEVSVYLLADIFKGEHDSAQKHNAKYDQGLEVVLSSVYEE